MSVSRYSSHRVHLMSLNWCFLDPRSLRSNERLYYIIDCYSWSDWSDTSLWFDTDMETDYRINSSVYLQSFIFCFLNLVSNLLIVRLINKRTINNFLYLLYKRFLFSWYVISPISCYHGWILHIIMDKSIVRECLFVSKTHILNIYILHNLLSFLCEAENSWNF